MYRIDKVDCSYHVYRFGTRIAIFFEEEAAREYIKFAERQNTIPQCVMFHGLAYQFEKVENDMLIYWRVLHQHDKKLYGNKVIGNMYVKVAYTDLREYLDAQHS